MQKRIRQALVVLTFLNAAGPSVGLVPLDQNHSQTQVLGGRPGWLGFGFTYHEEPAKNGEHWMFVRNLTKGGPAERAGMQLQDVIFRIDGRPIRYSDETEVLRFLAGIRPGQSLTLTATRRGSTKILRLVAREMTDEQFRVWRRNFDRRPR